MKTSGKFDPEQWRTLQLAPFWTFGVVAGADGKVSRKEFESLQEFIATSATLRSRLARDVVVSIAGDLDEVWNAFQADPRRPDQGLQEVTEVLERVSDEEATTFKSTLIGLGVRVANRSGRIGRRKMSDVENMAMNLLAHSLSFDPAEAERVWSSYDGSTAQGDWASSTKGDGGYI